MKKTDFMRWEIWWFCAVYLEGMYLKKTKGKVVWGNHMLCILFRHRSELPYYQRPYGFHMSWIYNSSIEGEKKKEKINCKEVAHTYWYRTVLQADLVLLHFVLLHFRGIAVFLKAEALRQLSIE